MLASRKPAVRVAGRGQRMRVWTVGDWSRDPMGALREACSTSRALDEVLAEALRYARANWFEIGQTLGVARVSGRTHVLEAWIGGRRATAARTWPDRDGSLGPA